MRSHSILPGFGLSLGVTLAYFGVVVLLPLAALVLMTFSMSLEQFWALAFSPRVMAAYEVSFGCALIAAILNVFFGLNLAWILTRYDFPGRRLVDAMIDLPFALPTAVAGIALATLYSKKGWIGSIIEPMGMKIAFAPAGIVVALTFIGLPFVVRTLEPVLQDLDPSIEEAAESLGASRKVTFFNVVLPHLLPALLTGFAMAFARGIGEYGSVIFIAGNLPNISEIAPLIIMTRLESFDVPGATAVASVMLAVSFLLLLLINSLQAFMKGRA